jgi:integrase
MHTLYRPTFHVVFDTKKTVDKTVGIIKIRVIYRRKSREYSTGIRLNIEKWPTLKRIGNTLDNRIKDEELIKLHHTLYGYTKRSGERVDGLVDQYMEVANQLLPNFSFAALKYRIETYGQSQVSDKEVDVLKSLEKKSQKMYEDGRIGSGDNFRSAGRSMMRFLMSLSQKGRMDIGLELLSKKDPNIRLRFDQITPDFLEAYELWMLKFGKSSKKFGGKSGPASTTCIGIYLRHIRTVFNDAITEKVVSKDLYPFGRRLFIIPQGQNTKKALSRKDLEKIKNYQPEVDFEQRALDFWLFTYFSNGINCADICLLRWQDIDESGEFFTFLRKKTLRTTKGEARSIKVFLRPETLAIIDRWGTTRTSTYIFPFVNDKMTPIQIKNAVGLLTHTVNKWMKRIGVKLGISQPLTMYVARHSFGTSMLRAGVPIKHISDSFGHGSITTTEKYLASFEAQEIREFLKAL